MEGLSYGTLIFSTIILPLVFSSLHKWNDEEIGFALMSPGIGGLVANIIVIKKIDYFYKKYQTYGSRLIFSFIGVIGLCLSTIVFGVTINKNVYGSIICLALQDFFFVFVCVSVQTFNIDIIKNETPSMLSLQSSSEAIFSSISTQLSVVAVEKSLELWYYLAGFLFILLIPILIKIIKSKWYLDEEDKKISIELPNIDPMTISASDGEKLEIQN
ncbi:major facilitator superfamily [Anaeramoeba flamelloides]|uniref:Major facilitator superfamily n=1 Tax=Anaeramoeba flamelloides TaxID=1746091 RepID=A0AAV7Z4Q7_9EUKA|nr:major facilitator superfamily [Anaeramoeba flamelloides]